MESGYRKCNISPKLAESWAAGATQVLSQTSDAEVPVLNWTSEM
jgi:hypothetical protein